MEDAHEPVTAIRLRTTTTTPTHPDGPTETPTVLTPAQIALFCDCPRRYAFQHVERIPFEFYPVAFAFGRAFHAAVVEAYTPLREYPDTARAQSRFVAMFHKECRENPVRFDEDSPSKLETLGLELVDAAIFHLSFRRITAVDALFEAPVGELLNARRPVVLRGRFTLRLADGEVGEIKTTRQPRGVRELWRSPQLRAYALAARLIEGRLPGMRVIQVRKAPGADICGADWRFEGRELDELVETLRRMLAAINARRFPRNVTSRCNSCPFQGRCLGIGSGP